MKIVITTGKNFVDIDGLACAIAYRELLEKEGEVAEVVFSGSLNKSVIEKIRKWNFNFRKYPSSKGNEFVLVDVSEKECFPDFVKEKGIREIYDHRHGFITYWKQRLDKASKIELVGACATLIWEEYKKRLKPIDISNVSANLLYTAILSNTLNFKASVTTEKDISAFKQLRSYADLPKNWIETYFKTQDKEVLKNPYESLINDTKKGEMIIGQLELWDSKQIVKESISEIERALTSFGNPKWFLTSPSISDGKNYLYTKDNGIKKLLSDLIDAKFKGDFGTTKKLWLRKEIIKKLQEKK